MLLTRTHVVGHPVHIHVLQLRIGKHYKRVKTQVYTPEYTSS